MNKKQEHEIPETGLSIVFDVCDICRQTKLCLMAYNGVEDHVLICLDDINTAFSEAANSVSLDELYLHRNTVRPTPTPPPHRPQ